MSFINDRIWYGNHFLKWLLLPLSWIYLGVHSIRRWYLQRFCQHSCPVPLIVVGNLSLGGVGKTPLVIELVKKMQERGLKVGVVSRGYGASIKNFPYEIQVNDSASFVGDEPLMIAQKTQVPVVISPRRIDAVEYLLNQHQVQIIISDDGLQHYRMKRAVEIAVIDGMRGFGNGLCLPAGPLREPKTRLKDVDFVVVNGGTVPDVGMVKPRDVDLMEVVNWGTCNRAYSMHLIPGKIRHLSTQEEFTPDFFTNKVAAFAAIGNPQRFYFTLAQLGIEFTKYSFSDHYQFKSTDLYCKESVIIMTEKDAVKCSSFNFAKVYYLPVEARLDQDFWEALWSHQQIQDYCKNDAN